MITVTVETDAGAFERTRAEWAALHARAQNPEPTLAPDWLAAWWRVFGPLDGRALRLAMLRDDGGRLVGVAPLLGRRFTYRPGIPFRRLELLGSGEDEADEVCSDYIGVLVAPGAEADVAGALAGALATGGLGPWDELVMPAMNGELALPGLLAAALRARGVGEVALEPCGAAPYIPLPRAWEGYLAALPGPRRYLVRRALRDVEGWAGGAVTIERVAHAGELARGREVLHALHGERWAQSGRAGVFASARFAAFHDAVMPALLATGALDLRWLVVRGEPVAALYNIVAGGKVYFYQSGRRADVPRGVRVGIAMHALTIRDAIERGLREYDFLGGVSQYKRDLALASRPLVRLRAARPCAVETARRTTEALARRARIARANVRWLVRGPE